jgi:hypothetical protein
MDCPLKNIFFFFQILFSFDVIKLFRDKGNTVCFVKLKQNIDCFAKLEIAKQATVMRKQGRVLLALYNRERKTNNLIKNSTPGNYISKINRDKE